MPRPRDARAGGTVAADQSASDTQDPAGERPFATVALIVLATQAFYLFHDTKDADPAVWPLWGLLAGGAAWLFLRPADLASAGFRRPRRWRDVAPALAAIAASLLCLAAGRALGAFEIWPGVNRMAPDLIGDLLLRMLCFYAVVLLGDELAFRSILQSEAIRRFGAVAGVVLVAVLFAVYRVPYAVRVGLVDVRPDSFELDRLGLVLLRGAIDGLALGCLFRLNRNLFATALYGWYLVALPALLLGNAEDPLEPMWFLVERGPGFDAVLWASALVPALGLAIANLVMRPVDELPEVRTPDWLVRNASFTPGADTPRDP